MRRIVDLLLFVSVVCVAISCSSSSSDEGREVVVSRTEIIGKVLSVEALSTGETVTRKRWSVSLQVLDPLNSQESRIKKGETVVLLVHSVIKSFGDDVADIKGNSYRVAYLQEFASPYDGSLEIMEAE